ncbi:MAG: recombination mediator RecR [Dehalococcoidia bacterium]|jgi:recombination protein RecR|nr:recombination mediator RecR [Dehalococcoidia bacterium]MDP7239646.1 recombination mediator RecR [Dehalococcoidia bacterium]MDP7469498.1 recombination mediator RecR [Dehalococcoidia bacterium]
MDHLSVPTSRPLSRLIESLHRMPGIGPKLAQRLAYYLLRASTDEAQSLVQAIVAVKEEVVLCSVCQNTADTSPCALCQDPARDRSLICVVEEPLDVLALERSGAFKGRYHVLHGCISPIDGIGPEDLKIRELLARMHDEEVQEVIMATNPNLEGEATSMYVQRLLSPLGVKVSRLARGLPFGGDVEYADEVTLSRALQDRHSL